MPIFKTKQQAKQQAEELASQYNIKYSDDGETFSIHAKDDTGGEKRRSDLMVDANQWFPSLSRKKRLTTKLFQLEAQKQDLAAIKEAETVKALALKKLQDQYKAKGAPNIGENTYKTPIKDIKPSTEIETETGDETPTSLELLNQMFIKKNKQGYKVSVKPNEFKLTHNDEDIQNFLDTNLTDWDKTQLLWKNREKHKGDIVSKKSVFSALTSPREMNWGMATGERQVITPLAIHEAQKAGQEYIQVGRNLYNVDQLITSLSKEGRWNPNITLDKEGLYDLKYRKDVTPIPFLLDKDNNYVLKKWSRSRTTLIPRK